MRLRSVTEDNEVEELHKRYGCALPSDYEKSKACYRVWEAELPEENGRGIGLAVGSAAEGSCQIRYLFLKKEVRTAERIVELLELLVKALAPEAAKPTVTWRYRVTEGRDDVYLRFARRLKEYSAESRRISRWMRIDSGKVRNKQSLRPSDTMGRDGRDFDGFRMVSLEEIPKNPRYLKQLEAYAAEDVQYLSPFNTDESYDPKKCWVLARESDDRLASWILCKRVGDGELEISRAYTAKQFRSVRLWVDFFGSVISQITEEEPSFRFQVAAENPKMLQSMKRYFADSMSGIFEERVLEICWK